MTQNVLIVDCAREDIGKFVSEYSSKKYRKTSTPLALTTSVESKSVRLGRWHENIGDPLPDFMVIRDEDYADTLAWLSAFMDGYAPITQWCRLIKSSDAHKLASRVTSPSAGLALMSWVGAVIAECSANLPQNVFLKDIRPVTALSGPTFAAGRLRNLWGEQADFADLLKRHEEISRRFNDHGKFLDKETILPLWQTLSGANGISLDKNRNRALEPFANIFQHTISGGSIDIEDLPEIARSIGSLFHIPEIEHCAIGPQSRRVSALDLVAKHLIETRNSTAMSAVLGFSASLVEPGAATLPELLRRHSNNFPLSAVWAGAFAGAWSPVRLLTENGGLGRIISKELVKHTDLFDKPSADIAFDELVRWVSSTGDGRAQLRGYSNRLLHVELFFGVTVPVGIAREQQKAETIPSQQPSLSAQRALDFEDRNRPKVYQPQTRSRFSESSIEDILRRLEALEAGLEKVSQRTTKTRTSTRKL